jgi:NitT/TauT family transport system ATP-binding protein
MVSTQAVQEMNGSLSDTPVLKFDQVGLEYIVDGQPRRIIEEISLSIAKGEFVTFVGPSGCGKTSILRMISGLAPALIGDLRHHDVPITKPLKNIGVAFQSPVLMPWRNIIQNVMLPMEIVQPYKKNFKERKSEYIKMAESLLDTVGLKDYYYQFPWQLSGGMRQRASLCRALIHQPELLLLDEPFGALDPFTREDMWIMLQSLWQQVNCSCVLITHDLREAVFLSDTVYVMSPRPSSIIYKLKPNLPRPTTIETMLSDEFNLLVADLRRHIYRS